MGESNRAAGAPQGSGRPSSERNLFAKLGLAPCLDRGAHMARGRVWGLEWISLPGEAHIRPRLMFDGTRESLVFWCARARVGSIHSFGELCYLRVRVRDWQILPGRPAPGHEPSSSPSSGRSGNLRSCSMSVPLFSSSSRSSSSTVSTSIDSISVNSSRRGSSSVSPFPMQFPHS